jgi:hypothetical protein
MCIAFANDLVPRSSVPPSAMGLGLSLRLHKTVGSVHGTGSHHTCKTVTDEHTSVVNLPFSFGTASCTARIELAEHRSVFYRLLNPRNRRKQCVALQFKTIVLTNGQTFIRSLTELLVGGLFMCRQPRLTTSFSRDIDVRHVIDDVAEATL